MKFSVWLKALPLFAVSFVEMTVSFVRMMILTNILGPYELGFAAALSATYALLEQSTDISMYRFVLATPRSEYKDVMAAAHAAAMLRSCFVATVILVAAYPASCSLASCSDWSSFAWLSVVAIIRSFENLEIRVKERDYHYWPQLAASLLSHTCGLVALALTAYQTRSHYAFIVYLLVHAIIFVSVSNLLSNEPYRVKFRTSYLRKAILFGLPLVFNGIGISIIAQGDRLMVGALLGLPALAHYAILILAGIVPTLGLLRVLGSIQLAGLHNVQAESAEHIGRIQLYGRAIPMIAASYALVLIAFLQPVLPFVFGPHYAVSELSTILVAIIAFLRIVRIEPHTSLLINAHQTAKLAIANLSLAIGLLMATALVLIFPKIEVVLVGGAIGEATGLCVMIFMTRSFFGRAIIDYLGSLLTMLVFILAAAALTTLVHSNNFLGNQVTVVSVLMIIIGIGAVRFLPRVYRRAYPSSFRIIE